MINNPDELIQQFIMSLCESIQAIEQNYFTVARYPDEVVLRERAYCYELYHQLRLHLGDGYPYTLHGEIDKRGQELFRRLFEHSPNPDFVVHQPMTMNNLVVIEVKNSNSNRVAAQADINKLKTFITGVDYQLGIFLLFGDTDPQELINSLDIKGANIIVLWHSTVRQYPVQLYPWFQECRYAN